MSSITRGSPLSNMMDGIPGRIDYPVTWTPDPLILDPNELAYSVAAREVDDPQQVMILMPVSIVHQ